MTWPPFNRLQNDPARRKGAAMAGMPGMAGYYDAVDAYNKDLARPSDTREVAPITPPTAYATGWQGPTGVVTSGDYSTPYGSASVRYPGAPTMGGMPGATVPLATASAAADTSSYPDAEFLTQPEAAAPAQPPAPAQNSMQRWSEQTKAQPEGMRELSNQRRYFWATGRIDARPTAADPSRNKGAIKASPLIRADGSASEVGSGSPVRFNKTNFNDWSSY